MTEEANALQGFDHTPHHRLSHSSRIQYTGPGMYSVSLCLLKHFHISGVYVRTLCLVLLEVMALMSIVPAGRTLHLLLFLFSISRNTKQSGMKCDSVISTES